MPLINISETWKPMDKVLKENGHSLVPITQNLVDLVWDDRPPPPRNPLMVLPDSYTGVYIRKIQYRHHLFVKKIYTIFLVLSTPSALSTP